VAKVSVTYDDSSLRANVHRFGSKLQRSIDAVVDYDAAYATSYLKTNAPWHDNTGAARSGLVAIPNHFGSTQEILMAYSVTYGIWLEVANSGKYAIITPAMRIIGQKLMSDMQLLIDRMGKIT
jgi:hypothetical protein